MCGLGKALTYTDGVLQLVLSRKTIMYEETIKYEKY